MKEIKKLIDNIDIRSEIPKEAIDMAIQKGAVIIYGASDDLMELRGSLYEEVGAYDGFCFEEEDDNNENLIEEIDIDVYRFIKKINLSAIWCPDDGTDKSWAFKISEGIEFETFNIMEDGEVFCEGIIVKK